MFFFLFFFFFELMMNVSVKHLSAFYKLPKGYVVFTAHKLRRAWVMVSLLSYIILD
jgi:hypothetical protein